jgi:ABC-type lipoprotein release transport system permease subunit
MNLEWLQTFYIVGAMVLLAVAVVAYPTLRANNKIISH